MLILGSLDICAEEMLTQKLPHKDMSFGQVLASVGAPASLSQVSVRLTCHLTGSKVEGKASACPVWQAGLGGRQT